VVLNIYLFMSLLCDIVRSRTLWAITNNKSAAFLFTLCVVAKLVVLLLEAIEKRSLLRQEYTNYPPEATAGAYNRNLFIWLCPLLIRGFGHEVDVNELYPNDKSLDPDTRYESLERRWNNRNRKQGHALLWVYVVHYRVALASAILPRLCLTGFRFAQPFLVHAAVAFLTAPAGTNTANYGYGLIGAYAIVYIGIAVSHALSLTSSFLHKL